MSDRTLALTSPHMHGSDVEQLQRDINAELKRWKVAASIKVDGEYGAATRDMAKTVLYGLGVANPQAELAHGVTPAIRLLIRNRDLSADQRTVFTRRADWRKRLADRYAKRGADLAVEFALAHIGVTEHPPGSNTGPHIDDWNRAVGTPPGPQAYWCGAFANACLHAAGFPDEHFMAYCPNIEQHARSGADGWRWHGPSETPQPGWLALFTEGGIAGHVELVVGVQGDHRPVTVGGNTSEQGKSGSQSNGGGVFRHTDRYASGGFPIRGYAAPRYH